MGRSEWLRVLRLALAFLAVAVAYGGVTSASASALRSIENLKPKDGAVYTAEPRYNKGPIAELWTEPEITCPRWVLPDPAFPNLPSVWPEIGGGNYLIEIERKSASNSWFDYRTYIPLLDPPGEETCQPSGAVRLTPGRYRWRGGFYGQFDPRFEFVWSDYLTNDRTEWRYLTVRKPAPGPRWLPCGSLGTLISEVRSFRVSCSTAKMVLRRARCANAYCDRLTYRRWRCWTYQDSGRVGGKCRKRGRLIRWFY